MKACKKSQKVFLYANSRKVTNVYHYIFHMKEDVDVSMLGEAVQKILPNFASLQTTIYKDEKDFYCEHNDREVPVFSGIIDDFVLIRDSYGYPFSVRCQEKKIRIDVAHACMDGFASQLFAQYVLGNYIYIKYGEIIDPAYLEEKSAEAIARADEDVSDSPLLKMQYDFADEEAGFEPGTENLKACKRFTLTFDENELNQYALRNQVKIYSVLIGMFIKTFENMYPDDLKDGETVSVGFPVNIRHRLSLEESLHNCSSELIIPFPVRKNITDSAHACLVQETIDRKVKSDLVLYNLQKCFHFVDFLIQEDCSLSMKQRIFRKGIASRVFHFSHMQKFPNGEKFSKYIADMEHWVPVLDYPLYSVTVRFNGKVKLYITHSHKENFLFPSLSKVLDQSGLDYKMDVFEPCKDGAIEYQTI